MSRWHALCQSVRCGRTCLSKSSATVVLTPVLLRILCSISPPAKTKRERYRDPEISWGRYFLSSVYEVFANSDHSWIREIAWFGTKVRVRYADSPGYPGEYLYLTCQWDPSRDCCGWVDYCGKSPLGGERLKLLSPSMELEHSSQCMNKHSTNVLLIDSIIM